jgi:topoisomerase-4 subunit B
MSLQFANRRFIPSHRTTQVILPCRNLDIVVEWSLPQTCRSFRQRDLSKTGQWVAVRLCHNRLSMTTKQHNYDEDKIKSLSALEHIRKRTGMYIGRVGDGADYDDGIYILLKEIVDNAVDEFIMGFGNRIAITVTGSRVTVRDYGRGIPLGKVVECVSRINTGAKYSDEVFQFSVGLNGIGAKAVNALSQKFSVRSFRDGNYAGAVFERGVLREEGKGKAPEEADGTYVSFEPDPEIFGGVSFVADHIIRRLRLYAFLNAGLRVEYNGQVYISRNGLLDLLRDEVGDEALYAPLHYRSKTMELSFTHTQRFEEAFLSFVNGQYTGDGWL